MEWIFLEALIALLLLVFIVWWTMRPPTRSRERESAGSAARADAAAPSLNAERAEPKE